VIRDSLRLRLMAGAAIAVALALALAWAVMTWLFTGHIERRVQEDLTTQARPLLAELQLIREVPALATEPSDPRFGVPASGLYWQASTAKGRIRSVSLWDAVLPAAPDAPADAWRIRRAAGPFGQRLMLAERKVRLQPDEPAITVQLGYDLARLAPAQREFGRVMGVFLALLWVTLSLAAWIQVALGLRPLAQVRRDLERLRRDASARLSGPYPREMLPLTQAIDALADARESDLVRARRRAADLAHGLKTPLAALAAQSARAREAGAGLAADGLESAIAAVRAAVDGELVRTRIGLVHEGRSTAAVPVLERLIAVLERTEAGEDIVFSVDCEDDVMLPLAGDDAAELLGPLLENATSHARRQVAISARSEPGILIMTIGDDGPGLEAEVRDTAVLRGERIDSAGGGYGLGLAIAREVAEATLGELVLGQSQLGGLEVQLRWTSAA